MTDQPTQDAIVSQRDREVVKTFAQEPYVVCYLTNTKLEGDWQDALAQAFATYRAEIEAATIERCAAWLKSEADESYAAMAKNPDSDMAILFGQRSLYYSQAAGMIKKATAIRNLKGQTS